MNPLDLLKFVTIARGEARLLIGGLDLKDGQRGADGSDGQQGGRGEVGEAGKQGQRGSIGKTGAHGLTGAAGASGRAGDAGGRGVKGLDGSVGPRGSRGVRGPVGPRGSDGDDGVGVASAKVDQKTRRLIITLTNGTKIDAGIVKPKDGVVVAVGGGSGSSVQSDDGFKSNEVLLWLSM